MIAYFRVSTSSQGRSGLGIEAQRAAVDRFAEAQGAEIFAEYVEVETGKGSATRRRSCPCAPCEVFCCGGEAGSAFA